MSQNGRTSYVSLSVPQIVYGSYDDDGAGIIVLMDLNDSGEWSIYLWDFINLGRLIDHSKVSPQIWNNFVAIPGYFPLNHCNGLSLPQLLTAVEKLAEFHAVGSAMIANQEEENIVRKYKGTFTNVISKAKIKKKSIKFML